MSNLVLYHSDLDGECSAAIVNYFVPDCEFYAMNYGFKTPWKKIKKADKVYMVDFGLQPFTDMLKLYDMKGDNFIWIDHHLTAIDEYKRSGQNFQGLRRVGSAGCELTWEYFVNDTRTMPRVVEMLGRYDVWDTLYHKDIMPFHYGMTLENMSPTDYRWSQMFNVTGGGEIYNKILNEGKVVERYQVSRYETFCKVNHFDIEWKGLKFICANAMLVSSMLFDGYYNETDYDAMLAFGWTGQTWTVSMYTCKDGINVGEIAKSMGGGGHKGASGFQCQELPFKLVGKGE